MKAKPNEDLDWLAYRYVNDELGEEQRESFEQRLLEDQEAREMVASAVELSHAMHAAVHSNSVAPASAVVWQRVAAAALTVAAAAVALVVLQWGPWQNIAPRQPSLASAPQVPAPSAPDSMDPVQPADPVAAVDGALAEMWAMQLAETEPETPPVDRSTWQESETEDDEAAINQWMWAAVDVLGEDLDDSDLEQMPEESL